MKKKAHELFSGNGDAAFGDTIYLTVLANVLGTKTGFKSTDGETGDYSSDWTVERDWESRTSLITDPPDGRMPPMTPEAQERRRAARAAMTRPAAVPADRSLAERCITYGSPQLMAGYPDSGQMGTDRYSAIEISGTALVVGRPGELFLAFRRGFLRL
jgi:hypothetical protein